MTSKISSLEVTTIHPSHTLFAFEKGNVRIVNWVRFACENRKNIAHLGLVTLHFSN